ncbi:sulfite exporter TauE/SafE family protein [Litoreibacter roseus]|uniref:Probable membrane transporter protein n=1 Tax=Litoreibacter roseus TaxID=2601869 RepID=A0A6N6JID8_9RHOB|nr:sulfite exporter TauE/SafE family protein [Litoreibacter roseus]GFE65874.1 membrane protein [Litoreibacter roseus]
MTALADALATPGVVWLILTISLAGIVRGFTGFGTALIFVPVAGRFLPPQDVIVLITLTGVASTAALLPRAWRQAERRDVGLLALAALLTVPLGVLTMQATDPATVRWVVAAIASVTVLSVATGYRYHGQIAALGLLAIGAVAGFIGGMTGLTGPVVIIFYLASLRAAATVRANTILFLAALDVVIFGNLLISGLTTAPIIWLAVLLAIPYFVTTLIGQYLFRPTYEMLYRRIAYGVVTLAVISGLPLFD